MDREEALAYGALAFFGDKYGEEVRVVEVPGFSKEFCGGTHVHHTGDIGLFLLTSEQGVSAGTRRVEALAGEAAVERAQADEGILEELEQTAKVDRRELVDEYARLRDQLKARERELQALKVKLASAAGPPARARGHGPDRARGHPGLDPALRGPRPQGARRGGGRVPEQAPGATLRPAVLIGERRGRPRHHRGVVLADRGT